MSEEKEEVTPDNLHPQTKKPLTPNDKGFNKAHDDKVHGREAAKEAKPAKPAKKKAAK